MLESFLLIYFNYVFFVFFRVSYEHRSLSHGTITYHPIAIKFIKILYWLCITDYTSKYFNYYVSWHTQHHMYSDTKDDVHSPYQGYKFGEFPSDPKQKIYDRISKHKDLQLTNFDRMLDTYHGGWWFALTAYTMLFGITGIIMAITIYCLPYVNSIGNIAIHKWPGYNNKPQKLGRARNLPYMSFLFIGEEWHGNHHLYPNTANHQIKWWEIDISYWILRFLSLFGVVKINR